jgi:two-component system sensor histidine kinase UhpB
MVDIGILKTEDEAPPLAPTTAFQTGSAESRARAYVRVSHWLWYDRSFRWRLIVLFSCINLAAGVVAGALAVYNAKWATKVEIAASMEVAERFVRGTVERLVRDMPGARPLENLPLQISNMRHVRILTTDANGRPVPLAGEPDEDSRDDAAGVPGWFAALLDVGDLQREVPVISRGEHIGSVFVVGHASDEIAEVWRDMSDLAILAGIVNLTVIALLFVALGRVLDPLVSLAVGLREMGGGNLRFRLPFPKVRELADIVDQFNRLASALDAARGDNTRLNRRLITVQDDERRLIASELHDELGPCLFGLRADAASIKRLTASLPEEVAESVRERVMTLIQTTERIQTVNRRLLDRIRPMALHHVPLKDVIATLVSEFEQHDSDCAFELAIGRIADKYGDCIDLTIYRCVQEGITNAIRHSGAKTIAIELEQRTTVVPDCAGYYASAVLRLAVKDDGCGIGPKRQPGLGLLGMEERVRALGGRFTISRRSNGGTRLDIAIPIDEAEWHVGQGAVQGAAGRKGSA